MSISSSNRATPGRDSGDATSVTPVDRQTPLPDDPIERRKFLERRMKELQEQNLHLYHEIEEADKKIHDLSSSLVTGVESAERKEEQLTNVMLRKLAKLEEEKKKLSAHLESEERSKLTLERRLRNVTNENVKLKEHLRAEERQIVTKLKRPLELLERQRRELEAKVAEESTDVEELENTFQQFKDGMDGLGSTVMSFAQDPDTTDVGSETTSQQVRGRSASIDLSATPRDRTPSVPTSTTGRHPSQPLTSQRLQQLQVEALNTPSKRESILESYTSGVPPESQDTSLPPAPSVPSVESTPRLRPSGSYLGASSNSVGRAFSPIPSAVVPSAYLQYKPDEVEASSVCDSGRSTPAAEVLPSNASITSSLADDGSMIAQLHREIQRLQNFEKRTLEKTKRYEEKVNELQKEVAKATEIRDRELTTLSDISSRLVQTSSQAHELSAQNETIIEWSTDRSVHGASRCSVSSSVAATPLARDSEASTPVQQLSTGLLRAVPRPSPHMPPSGLPQSSTSSTPVGSPAATSKHRDPNGPSPPTASSESPGPKGTKGHTET